MCYLMGGDLFGIAGGIVGQEDRIGMIGVYRTVERDARVVLDEDGIEAKPGVMIADGLTEFRRDRVLFDLALILGGQSAFVGGDRLRGFVGRRVGVPDFER